MSKFAGMQAQDLHHVPICLNNSVKPYQAQMAYKPPQYGGEGQAAGGGHNGAILVY